MRVMVLGGYGNFGARICRALAGSPSIELLVAGRDGLSAQNFAETIPARDRARGVAVDMHSPDFSRVLVDLNVELLIHTAGPFQGQHYSVARACGQAGAHYIDLADGRRFVCDFAPALDAEFKVLDRVAICGASTVPALSSAVVNALCGGWQAIETIDICIAPAQTAPRGVATMRAVLGYCGEAIQVWRNGQWQSLTGWGDPQPVEIRGLKARLGSPCDIPDLELFPSHYAVRNRVEFRAAVEVTLAQRVFAAMAWLRRHRVFPNPAVLAGALNAGAKCFDPFGSALGGMVVRVSGTGVDGNSLKRSWHIAADHDHGPEIPCLAAILLARKLASGQRFTAGAYPAMGLLALDEFSPEFAKWGMVTQVVEER
uniref:Saccharopine dehydrogenase NADP binding domain-containing protein n=1 Tax=Curvibacter symbiont subsp. Hydra magnipapillata TaxID=667019 RepID=C9YGG1_CURXX|nr:hypothetical protein Csp_B18610 [Curvibacter putative symbiont of Hydra magnipapillata]